MTDVPPGPGWWKASDGNWYPPQPAPGAAPTPPPPMYTPPAAKNNKGCLIALAIFFGILVVGVIVGGIAITFLGRAASDKLEDVGDALSTPSTVNPGDVDARSEDEVLDVGESVRISGYTATVRSAEFVDEVEGYPADGYLVLLVSIENRDEDNQAPTPISWNLQLPDGQVTAPITLDGVLAGSIAEGATAEGRIVFQVGTQEGDFFVLYRPDLFDEARGVWPVSR